MLVSVALLIVSRLPLIVYGGELSRDEGLLFFAADRLLEDWLPWRGYNTGSCGPIPPSIVALFRLAGMPASYGALHLLALLQLLGTFALGWLVARRFVAKPCADLGFIVITLVTALDPCPDYITFATEIPCILTLALGLFLLVSDKGTCTSKIHRLTTGSLVLGLVPWCKFQAAPIALAACAWIALSLALDWGNTGRNLTRRGALILLAALCAILPSAALLGAIVHGGAWLEFYNTVFVGNMSYVSAQRSALVLMDHAIVMLFNPWMVCLLTCTAACLTQCPSALWRSEQRPALVLVSLLSLTTWASVLKSPYAFPHYLLLVLPATHLGIALMLGCLHGVPHMRGRLALAGLVLAFGTPALYSALGNFKLTVLTWTIPDQIQAGLRTPSLVASTVIPKGSSVYVWGWAPSTYVRLEARSPNMYSDFCYMIMESPVRDYFRGNLMRDLKASPPEWIVIVADGFWFPVEQTRPFPALQSFMDAGYFQVFDDGTHRILRRRK